MSWVRSSAAAGCAGHPQAQAVYASDVLAIERLKGLDIALARPQPLVFGFVGCLARSVTPPPGGCQFIVRSCSWTRRLTRGLEPYNRLPASARFIRAVCDHYGLGQVHAAGRPHATPTSRHSSTPTTSGSRTRTGIHERRVSHVSAQRDGQVAARRALACAGLDGPGPRSDRLRQLQHEEQVPNMASGLQARLGAHARGGDGRQHRVHELPVRALDGDAR